jgi:hypothetical protein
VRLPASARGQPTIMEGGVAIFLLLVIAVAAIGFGIALYVTGGAILGSSKGRNRRRPKGKTHPIAENTTAMRVSEQRETSDKP